MKTFQIFGDKLLFAIVAVKTEKDCEIIVEALRADRRRNWVGWSWKEVQ